MQSCRHGAASLPRGCSPCAWTTPSAHLTQPRRHARSQVQAAPSDATPSATRLSLDDLSYLQQAAKLADSSAGLSQPHPNAGCILVSTQGRVLSSAFLRAQGTVSAEVQAVQQARDAARGSTAYLNLESGDCHGDTAAVQALLGAGVSRVVMGMRHPLAHARGQAVKALRQGGVHVDVLGECSPSPVVLAGVVGSERSTPFDEATLETWQECVRVNEALLHRAVLRRPMSILKYAMTLDGKIATQMGHSAWVTSPPARALVFEQRARSDAVIVGGNTVRRDNPRLTTRREGGHTPVRVVMSRTLDLPQNAELWDVSVAPTIVMTQRGARQHFQSMLRSKGVEVVEFDFLTPENVADYCYDRGFLQCFWECGGVLSAPCISSNVIHKVVAFVAPKIIGGERAPSPVGELGFVEMTQAVQLDDVKWRQVGPDLMIEGFLPTSGGPLALEASIDRSPSTSSPPLHLGNPTPPSTSTSTSTSTSSTTTTASAASPSTSTSTSSASSAASPSTATPSSSAAVSSLAAAAASARPASSSSASSNPSTSSASSSSKLLSRPTPPAGRKRNGASAAPSQKLLYFYKAWDQWGALGNFSPHPVTLPHAGGGEPWVWASVEHYYQASKISATTDEGKKLIDEIAAMPSPEEAARLGRRMERSRPDLLRPDWADVKVQVMLAGLQAKFSANEGPRALLLSTGSYELVESSPHDFFWGQGYDGSGRNNLGRLLMYLRGQLAAAAGAKQQQQGGA